eukprot:gene894-1731_t
MNMTSSDYPSQRWIFGFDVEGYNSKELSFNKGISQSGDLFGAIKKTFNTEAHVYKFAQISISFPEINEPKEIFIPQNTGDNNRTTTRQLNNKPVATNAHVNFAKESLIKSKDIAQVALGLAVEELLHILDTSISKLQLKYQSKNLENHIENESLSQVMQDIYLQEASIIQLLNSIYSSKYLTKIHSLQSLNRYILHKTSTATSHTTTNTNTSAAADTTTTNTTSSNNTSTGRDNLANTQRLHSYSKHIKQLIELYNSIIILPIEEKHKHHVNDWCAGSEWNLLDHLLVLLDRLQRLSKEKLSSTSSFSPLHLYQNHHEQYKDYSISNINININNNNNNNNNNNKNNSNNNNNNNNINNNITNITNINNINNNINNNNNNNYNTLALESGIVSSLSYTRVLLISYLVRKVSIPLLEGIKQRMFQLIPNITSTSTSSSTSLKTIPSYDIQHTNLAMSTTIMLTLPLPLPPTTGDVNVEGDGGLDNVNIALLSLSASSLWNERNCPLQRESTSLLSQILSSFIWSEALVGLLSQMVCDSLSQWKKKDSLRTTITTTGQQSQQQRGRRSAGDDAATIRDHVNLDVNNDIIKPASNVIGPVIIKVPNRINKDTNTIGTEIENLSLSTPTRGPLWPIAFDNNLFNAAKSEVLQRFRNAMKSVENRQNITRWKHLRLERMRTSRRLLIQILERDLMQWTEEIVKKRNSAKNFILTANPPQVNEIQHGKLENFYLMKDKDDSFEVSEEIQNQIGNVNIEESLVVLSNEADLPKRIGLNIGLETGPESETETETGLGTGLHDGRSSVQIQQAPGGHSTMDLSHPTGPESETETATGPGTGLHDGRSSVQIQQAPGGHSTMDLSHPTDFEDEYSDAQDVNEKDFADFDSIESEETAVAVEDPVVDTFRQESIQESLDVFITAANSMKSPPSDSIQQEEDNYYDTDNYSSNLLAFTEAAGVSAEITLDESIGLESDDFLQMNGISVDFFSFTSAMRYSLGNLIKIQSLVLDQATLLAAINNTSLLNHFDLIEDIFLLSPKSNFLSMIVSLMIDDYSNTYSNDFNKNYSHMNLEVDFEDASDVSLSYGRHQKKHMPRLWSWRIFYKAYKKVLELNNLSNNPFINYIKFELDDIHEDEDVELNDYNSYNNNTNYKTNNNTHSNNNNNNNNSNNSISFTNTSTVKENDYSLLSEGIFCMHGLSCLTIKYNAPSPLSAVFSIKTMDNICRVTRRLFEIYQIISISRILWREIRILRIKEDKQRSTSQRNNNNNISNELYSKFRLVRMYTQAILDFTSDRLCQLQLQFRDRLEKAAEVGELGFGGLVGLFARHAANLAEATFCMETVNRTELHRHWARSQQTMSTEEEEDGESSDLSRNSGRDHRHREGDGHGHGHSHGRALINSAPNSDRNRNNNNNNSSNSNSGVTSFVAMSVTDLLQSCRHALSSLRTLVTAEQNEDYDLVSEQSVVMHRVMAGMIGNKERVIATAKSVQKHDRFHADVLILFLGSL